MMRFVCLLLFAFIAFTVDAQVKPVFSGFPGSAYQSAQNEYYWKNRKPFEGYWQQDVHYKISADVDEKTDIVSGQEELIYYNNSPDVLNYVYFHLYSNAQVKESYLSDLFKNNGLTLTYGKYQQQNLGTNIEKIASAGRDLKMELDNTVLKVFLQKSLMPGESVSFHIDFKTYFDTGTIRNRMKMFNAFGYKHYDLVHWYPRISVYDRKMGWDTDQHLDHEFYGDYGTFDVEITFANNYVLDATGILINPEEVLPAELRKQLDIKNFANKPWNSRPSEIIKPDGGRKIWKFHAENVHDFALTADPTYRIGEAEWNGIKCIALVQESHASRWQTTAEYVAKIIKSNSEDFGMYAYPKMIAADAQDGMEYPMLTLDGGGDPDYKTLLIHEISHNWFFGMVGNNETYRAAMDEGFTQFLTAWTFERIDGKKIIKGVPVSNYIRKYLKVEDVRENQVYRGYVFDAIKGSDATLNTHSDGFNGTIHHGGGYRQVYYKTATMLYNLQYVLGDELFLKTIQHYFNQWKICHPYMEDFRSSVIGFTKVDLNWFFDQWMETTKIIDYKVGRVKKGKEENEYIITFNREGRMQMPIDFQVTAKDGKKYNYYIPNNWFEKSTNATILPRWIGWDNIQKEYKAEVIIPNGISDVRIDTSYRLADLNMLNNSKQYPVTISLDHRIYNTPDRKNYEIFMRPDVWYNAYDGIKTGVAVNGSYLNYFHQFDAAVWYNTGLGQYTKSSSDSGNKHNNVMSYRFYYKTATNSFVKNSSVYFSSRFLDGLNLHRIGFEVKDKKDVNHMYGFYKAMWRQNSYANNYLLYPAEWGSGKFNNTINLGIDHKYLYKRGSGNITLNVKSSALGSDYNYSQISMTVVNKNVFGKFDFNTRTFFQYGFGNNQPSESALFFASANPEEMMENKYLRSAGFVPNATVGFYGINTSSFQYGGGLNMRGYAGYLMPQVQTDGSYSFIYKGTSGAAVNAELGFDRLIQVMPSRMRNYFKVNTYLFGDVGVIDYTNIIEKKSFSKPRFDAGLGTAFTIKKWGALQMVEPLTLRFDMPFFISNTPNVSPEYVKFRWLISVSRAF